MASRYFAAGKIRAGWFHGRKLSQHKQERALLLLHALVAGCARPTIASSTMKGEA